MKNQSYDLHRFSEAFKSEDELRKHLVTLLNKMPHTQGVQITHGSQEHGKDIVFYAPDGFYNYQLNACVVKNTKISGSVDDNAGARTVFIQAEQALDTPFVNGAGEKERVSKVFIISPLDCSQTTMHSIEGTLKNHFGKVEFLCGVKLFEKFSEYWPEFVIFESTLLGAYVAALQQNFDQSDPIAFLASQHYILSSVNKTLKNVYVRQEFKISLQEFEFLVEPPNFQTLVGPVTEREVNDIREQIDFVIPFIQRTQVWEKPDPTAAFDLEKSLKKLSDRLKERWEEEFVTLQQQCRSEGKRAPSRQSTELTIHDFDNVKQEPSVRQLMEILDAFRDRVRQANALAQEGKSLVVSLDSEAYRNYCRVKEVTHMYPSAFRKVSKVCDKYYPEDLLNQMQSGALITAPAGFGKTSFCKWNTLNDIQGLIGKITTVIPIYVPLHQLATAKLDACEEAFLRSPEVKQMFFAAHKNRQHVRVYLDGLDEVSTTDQQERLMKLAEQLSQRYSPTQIIVTGRDYVSGPWLRWLSRIHLSELNAQQVNKLVSKWLDNDPAEYEVFKKQLANSNALQALMKVPLLGTLIIAVFKKMRSLPEGKVKLYGVFLDLMCGGWDLAKNVRRETRFGSQAKLGVLTRLAGLLHANSKRVAQEADVRTAVTQTMGAFADQWRNLLDEILAGC